MAKRTLSGQLHMFDFYRSMEGETGEVEMVSLIPNFDAELEVVDELEVAEEPETVEIPEIVDERETAEVSEVVKERDPVVEPKAAEELETVDELESGENPATEAEPEVADVPVTTQATQEQVAMSRTYEIDGETIEIAYINYNKVRITRGENPPEIKLFASSKEAVDYYVEKMQELEER